MTSRWHRRAGVSISGGLFAVGTALAVLGFAPGAASAQTTFPIEDPAPAPEATPAPESMETPRTLALGTGAAASSMSTAALADNVGGMALSKLYHIEGSVGYSPAVARWILGASVVDSSTSSLAAGLSFRGILGASDEGYSGWDARLGLAYPLADMIALGLGGRYITLTSDGQVGEAVDDTLAEGFTLDASVVVAPFEGLRIAGLAYNFIDIDSPLAPVRFGGSASYTLAEMFTIGADVLADLSTNEDTSIIAGGGAELLIAGKVPLRGGYAFDGARSVHSVTAGLGYVEQRFGAELSLRQDVAGASDTTLLASFRYFVH